VRRGRPQDRLRRTGRVFGDLGATMSKLGDVDFAEGVCASLGWLSQSLTYEGLLTVHPLQT